MEESENLYKLYGYGLCNGTPPKKIKPYKVQESLHLGTWNFWWVKVTSCFFKYNFWDNLEVVALV